VCLVGGEVCPLRFLLLSYVCCAYLEFGLLTLIASMCFSSILKTEVVIDGYTVYYILVLPITGCLTHKCRCPCT
jgi:hypothetical protein